MMVFPKKYHSCSYTIKQRISTKCPRYPKIILNQKGFVFLIAWLVYKYCRCKVVNWKQMDFSSWQSSFGSIFHLQMWLTITYWGCVRQMCNYTYWLDFEKCLSLKGATASISEDPIHASSSLWNILNYNLNP